MPLLAVRCKHCLKRFQTLIEMNPEGTTLEPMDLPCPQCKITSRYDWKDFELGRPDEDESPS
jgi:hypothetical protein